MRQGQQVNVLRVLNDQQSADVRTDFVNLACFNPINQRSDWLDRNQFRTDGETRFHVGNLLEAGRDGLELEMIGLGFRV